MSAKAGESARELERIILALREELGHQAPTARERRLRHAIALLHGAVAELEPLRADVVEADTSLGRRVGRSAR
jgi:hypothetical protein